MKKVIALLCLLLPLAILAQNDLSANVTGNLKNVKDTLNRVYINYSANGKRVADSADIINNKYSFKLKTKEPVRVQLLARNTENRKQRVSAKSVAFVYLEPGNIQITNVDSFSNVKVNGSKAHLEYEKLEAQLKPYNEQIKSLSDKYVEFRKAKNTIEADKVDKAIDSIDEKSRNEVYGKYVKKYPASPLAVYALGQYAGYYINPSKVDPLFKLLSEKNKKSESGKALENRIETAKKLDIGQVAIDFTQNDTLGNPVTLSSFKGKYVLVDFWASWCGPCRAENPNVVKAFNEFKEKGFTILSVSLDQPGAKEKWLKAIHDDGLAWTHVSDLQYWNNAVAKTYGIQAIPANYLLDPQGKIIAKNLRGEDLANKLKGLL